jgi:hypothetical protein
MTINKLARAGRRPRSCRTARLPWNLLLFKECMSSNVELWSLVPLAHLA